MTEITQADRDAAISGYYAWCSGNPVIPNKIASGVMDDHSMVQAFARHRMAERARIVAWLRKEAIMSTDSVRRRMNKALDQIEAGAHEKEIQP